MKKKIIEEELREIEEEENYLPQTIVERADDDEFSFIESDNEKELDGKVEIYVWIHAAPEVELHFMAGKKKGGTRKIRKFKRCVRSKVFYMRAPKSIFNEKLKYKLTVKMDSKSHTVPRFLNFPNRNEFSVEFVDIMIPDETGLLSFFRKKKADTNVREIFTKGLIFISTYETKSDFQRLRWYLKRENFLNDIINMNWEYKLLPRVDFNSVFARVILIHLMGKVRTFKPPGGEVKIYKKYSEIVNILRLIKANRNYLQRTAFDGIKRIIRSYKNVLFLVASRTMFSFHKFMSRPTKMEDMTTMLENELDLPLDSKLSSVLMNYIFKMALGYDDLKIIFDFSKKMMEKRLITDCVPKFQSYLCKELDKFVPEGKIGNFHRDFFSENEKNMFLLNDELVEAFLKRRYYSDIKSTRRNILRFISFLTMNYEFQKSHWKLLIESFFPRFSKARKKERDSLSLLTKKEDIDNIKLLLKMFSGMVDQVEKSTRSLKDKHSILKRNIESMLDPFSTEDLFSIGSEDWESSISKYFVYYLFKKVRYSNYFLSLFLKNLKNRKKKDGLKKRIINELVDQFDGPDVSKILENSVFWKTVFEFREQEKEEEDEGEGEDENENEEEENSNISNGIANLKIFLRKFVNHELVVRELEQLFEKTTEILYFSKKIGLGKEISMDIVELRKRDFENFKSEISNFKLFYRNFISQRGEFLDSTIEDSLLLRIQDYRGKKFGDVKDSLAGYPFLQELEKLSQYANSELFLLYWDQQILSYSLPNENNNNNINNEENDNNALLINELNEDTVIVDGNENKNNNIQRIGTKVLKETIYKNVRTEYDRLYTFIVSEKIEISELGEVFKECDEKQRNRELKILFETNGEKSEELLIKYVKKIENAFFGKLQFQRIPSISKFCECFSFKLREISSSQDFIMRLRSQGNIDWNKATLKDVTGQIGKIKDIFITILPETFDLILLFSEIECRSLIHFLMKYENNREFIKFSSVLRDSCTDEFILNCSYHLDNTRNQLANILYPKEKKFIQIVDIINELNKIENKEDFKKSLKTSYKSLKQLQMFYKKSTTSLDIRALIELIEIDNKGLFKIDISGDRKISVYSILKPPEETKEEEEEENEGEDEDENKNKNKNNNFNRRRKKSLKITRNNMKQKKFGLQELREIKLLIMNSRIPNDFKKRYSDIEDTFTYFSRCVDILTSFSHCLNKINEDFTFEMLGVKPYEFDFGKIRDNVFVMDYRLKQINEKYDLFKNTLNTLQLEHFYLNYFSTSEISKLVRILQDYVLGIEALESKEKLISLLSLIEKDICEENRIYEFIKIFKDVSRNKDFDGLSVIKYLGIALEKYIRGENPKINIIQALPYPPISFVNIKENQASQQVLSILALTKNRTESCQFVLCDQNTTFSDLKRFCRRWEKARKYRPKNGICYILSDAGELSFEVLYQFVNFLKECSTACSGHLFIISSVFYNICRPFLYRDKTLLLGDQKINNYMKKVCGERFIAVKSAIPGGGKSEWIRNQCGNRFQHVRIIFREEVNESMVINSMNNAMSMCPNIPILYHFDISSYVDRKVDRLCFQLIHSGTLHEERNCQVFQLREMDRIFFEIPNTLNTKTKNSLFLFGGKKWGCPFIDTFVPSILLEVNRNQYNPNNNKITEIQTVCQFLSRIKKNDYSHFDPLMETKSFPMDECYDILTKYLGRNPSYRLIEFLVQFLYFYFEKIARYQPLMTDSHQHLGFLRKMLIDLIIQSSKDFVQRHIQINQNSEDFFDRFKSIVKWDIKAMKPLVVFKLSRYGNFQEDIEGVSVLSINPEEVKKIIPTETLQWLTLNKVLKIMDFETLSKEKPMELEGVCMEFINSFTGSKDKRSDEFVFTKENLMKIIGILLRIETNLPILMVGETGVGKTFTFEFLCRKLGMKFHKLTIHEGLDDITIERRMKQIFQNTNQNQRNVIVFLDEINTRPFMKIFEELIYDRQIGGVKVPDQVKFVAALNPYRKREFKAMGLPYPKGGSDLLKSQLNVVYRVFPCPESFFDSLFSFGNLRDKDEIQYSRVMIYKGIDGLTTSDINLLSQLVIFSHRFLRKEFKEVSICSLRDIQRFIKVYQYLRKEGIIDIVKKSDYTTRLVVTIGFTYYSSLGREARKKYLKEVVYPQTRIYPLRFERVFFQTCREFTMRLALRKTYALNEALCENSFVSFLCYAVNIPVLIIGLPGSSKTLCCDLISKSFRGDGSITPFCRGYSAFQIFDYQISPSTKANGIIAILNRAKKYQKETGENVILLLEEIGLALLSPHNPLKVLHEIIANRNEIRISGISNYDLDSANQNRFKLILRDRPVEKDLEVTAKSMSCVSSKHVELLLRQLAHAFLKVYSSQIVENFFGLREFYYLVRSIAQHHQKNRGTITSDILLRSVLRNFGGRPVDEQLRIIRVFESECRFDLLANKLPSVTDLIKDNLADKDSRHLMLITRNNSALNMLFDLHIIEQDRSTVLFGSDFVGDRSDEETNCQILEQIKLCMAAGSICVLVHCNGIYEAIFDLLNQHYTTIENMNFAKLAMGHSTSSYLVADEFRIIIIVDQKEAYESLSAPFLNRLEKQVFYRGMDGLYEPGQKYRNLVDFVNSSMFDTGSSFIGFHKLSLVCLEMAFPEKEEFELRSMLLRTATPEAILRTKNRSFFEDYFLIQHHGDLLEIIERIKIKKSKESQSQSIVIMTTTSIPSMDEKLGKEVNYFLLHEMKSSRDLMGVMKDFMKIEEDSKKESFLVIYAENVTQKQIQFTQFEYTKRLRTLDNNNNKNNKNKEYLRHMILIIKIAKDNSLFTFDFDRRWEYLYIDDLNEISSYHFPFKMKNPELTKMIQKSLVEVFEDLDVSENIRSLVVNSFQYLNYSENSMPPNKKIVQIEEFYVRNIPLLEQKILEVVGSKKNQKEWYFNVISENKNNYKKVDSFKRSLYCYAYDLYCKIFATIIHFCDQNENLSLLLPTEEEIQENEDYEFKKKIWLSFLQNVSSGKLIDSLEIIENGVNLTFDSNNNNFKCEFPFSYLLSYFFRSLRNEDIILIENQMKLFFPMFEEIKDPSRLLETKKEMVSNYVKDYCKLYGILKGGPLYLFHSIFLSKQIQSVVNSNESSKIIRSVDELNCNLVLKQTLLWKQEEDILILKPLMEEFTKMENIKCSVSPKDLSLVKFEFLKLSLEKLVPKFNESSEKLKIWKVLFRNLEWSIISLLNDPVVINLSQNIKILEFRKMFRKIHFFHQFCFRMDGLIEVSQLFKLWNEIIVNFEINKETYSKFNETLKNLQFEDECSVCYENVTENALMIKHNCGLENKLIHEKCSSMLIRDNQCTACRKKKNNMNNFFMKLDDEDMKKRRTKSIKIKSVSSFVMEDFINSFLLLRKTPNGIPNDLIQVLIETAMVPEHFTEDFFISEHSRSSFIRKILSLDSEVVEECFEKELEKKKQRMKTIDSDFTRVLSLVLESTKNKPKQKKEKERKIEEEIEGEGEEETEVKKVKNENPNLTFIKKVVESKIYFTKNLRELITSLEKNNHKLSNYFSLHPQVFIYFLKVIQQKHGLFFTKKFLERHQKVECIASWIRKNQKEFKLFTNFIDDNSPFPLLFGPHNWFKFLRNNVLPKSPKFQEFIPALLFERKKNHKFQQVPKTSISEIFQSKKFHSVPLTSGDKKEYKSFRSPFLRRVMVHIISSLCMKEGMKGTIFRTFFVSATKFVDCYIPTVSSDHKEMLVRILGRGQFYQCPNGHFYFVGECGKTMEKGKCNVCGAEIGGEKHVPVKGQKMRGRNFVSGKKNYLVPFFNIIQEKEEENENKNEENENEKYNIYETERKMSPKQFRILRFIVNVLLYFYCVSKQLEKQRLVQFKKRFIPEEILKGVNPETFLLKHLERDWIILQKLFKKSEEYVSLVIHLVISQLSNEITNKNKNKNKNIWFNTDLKKERDRNQVEYHFCKLFQTTGFLEEGRLGNKVSEFQINLSKMQDREDPLSLLILEKIEIQESDYIGKRKEFLPSLFKYHKSFQKEVFLEKCSLFIDKIKFPLLSHFGKNFDVLKTMDCLKDALIFLEWIYKKFNRRITPQQAQEITMKMVLEEEEENSKNRNMKKIFSSFVKSFNILWKHIRRLECQELPENLKISKDSNLSTFLPQLDSSDNTHGEEVSILLILVKYFIDAHNKYIEISENSYNPQQQIENNNNNNNNNNKFLTSHYFISTGREIKFDESEFFNFVKDHSGYKEKYYFDLQNIEYFLHKKYFCNRPLIKLEIPKFRYLNVYYMKFNYLRKLICELIPQEEFDHFLRKEVLEIISSISSFNISSKNSKEEKSKEVQQRKLFQFLQIGMQYLDKPYWRSKINNSKFQIEEKRFYEYLMNDILVPKIDEVYPLKLREIVKMKHIIALFDLMEMVLNEDIFVNIPNLYKFQINEDWKDEILRFLSIQDLQEVKRFFRVLKQFILQYFVSESYNVEEKLFIYFELLEDNNNNNNNESDPSSFVFDWILELKDEVKDVLKVKHVCEFYKIIEEFVVRRR